MLWFWLITFKYCVKFMLSLTTSVLSIKFGPKQKKEQQQKQSARHCGTTPLNMQTQNQLKTQVD